jgi:hypothetical protein
MTKQTIDDAIVEAEDIDNAHRKPIHKANYRGVSFAMFPATVVRDDGTEVTLFNLIIERRYKGKDGEYHSTSSFSEEHLAIIEDFAREARSLIRKERAKQKTES